MIVTSALQANHSGWVRGLPFPATCTSTPVPRETKSRRMEAAALFPFALCSLNPLMASITLGLGAASDFSACFDAVFATSRRRCSRSTLMSPLAIAHLALIRSFRILSARVLPNVTHHGFAA